jgi:hypothetical protein
MPSHFYFGLDLGQRRDPSAVAVVERMDPVLNRFDPEVYFGLRQADTEPRFGVRHLERIPLGTSYPDVVERVRVLTRRPEVREQATLVVDGTGVGRPVVDLLKRADLDCEVVEVSITAGAAAHLTTGCWYVPKLDLIGAVQVLVERGRLVFGREVPETGRLIEELMGMRMRTGGGWRDGAHDDLAMALSLACWRGARR